MNISIVLFVLVSSVTKTFRVLTLCFINPFLFVTLYSAYPCQSQVPVWETGSRGWYTLENNKFKVVTSFTPYTRVLLTIIAIQ